jgi:hypothetical protein
VDVAGITFSDEVAADIRYHDGFSVTLRDVAVTNNTIKNHTAYVSLDATRSGSLRILRSTIDTRTATHAIQAIAKSGSTLQFDAIGNRVTVGNANGIPLFVEALDASIRARIMNNLIRRGGGCIGSCPTPGGITLMASQSAGLIDVIGNTVDSSATNAIGVWTFDDDPAGLTVNAYNNILSHAQAYGIKLTTSGPPPTVNVGYNDYYSDAGGASSGVGQGRTAFRANPRFVDSVGGNYRLAADSPVIDAGLVCSPGGLANPDADGHGRLHGSAVDLGAYEFGAGAPGMVRVGTTGPDILLGSSGDDILCGYAGTDTLRGGGGNDFLDGGTGGDTEVGGPGQDRLLGGPDNDKLCVNDGAGGDFANGGQGTDRYHADAGDTVALVETMVAACP